MADQRPGDFIMKRIVVTTIAAGALVLAGCGSSTGDRAASGAGIGAAAGTVLGAVTGLSLVQGAVIGAAAGGLLGGFTDQSQINLGDPIWAKGDTKANKAAVGRVQAGLNKLGYDAGPVDGVQGQKTTNAIKRYQADHKLLQDGLPTQQLAQHIDTQLQQTAAK
jgi:peptidoglycan hydrolase-like protein with peptidoglycan-binding domain